MRNKFAAIPVDEDTIILEQSATKLGGYDVFHQKWCWDGISAESIIFANDDIAEVNDSALELTIRNSRFFKANSSVTIKRTEQGFTFVNFNFITS
jgi:hypothetical protein